MSFNMRNRIATGFGDLVADRQFFPVELIDPEGVEYKINARTGGMLKGEVLYDKDALDPETGDIIVVSETAVTIFKEHLIRVPKAGERWVIKFPLNPANQTVLSTFVLNTDKAPIDGASIGFIKLFPKDLEQSATGLEPITTTAGENITTAAGELIEAIVDRT